MKFNLTAENTFTDAIEVDNDYFDLSITNIFVGTITVQRKKKTEGSSEWRDLPITYTEPTEKVSARIRNKWEFRAGFKTGDYTSGTATVELI